MITMSKTTKPRATAETPGRLVYNVATGEATVIPLTDEELAERAQREQDATDQAAAAETEAEQRSQTLAAVRAEAASNPAYAALARLLGVEL